MDGTPYKITYKYSKKEKTGFFSSKITEHKYELNGVLQEVSDYSKFKSFGKIRPIQESRKYPNSIFFRQTGIINPPFLYKVAVIHESNFYRKVFNEFFKSRKFELPNEFNYYNSGIVLNEIIFDSKQPLFIAKISREDFSNKKIDSGVLFIEENNIYVCSQFININSSFKSYVEDEIYKNQDPKSKGYFSMDEFLVKAKKFNSSKNISSIIPPTLIGYSKKLNSTTFNSVGYENDDNISTKPELHLPFIKKEYKEGWIGGQNVSYSFNTIPREKILLIKEELNDFCKFHNLKKFYLTLFLPNLNYLEFYLESNTMKVKESSNRSYASELSSSFKKYTTKRIIDNGMDYFI